MLSKLSFKARLMGAVGLLAGVAAFFFGMMALMSETALETGKKSQLQAATDSVMDKLDRNLFERYGDVQAYSMSEPARSGSRERIVPFMNEMMGAYAPIYDIMMVVNKSGRVIAANTIDKAGKPLDTSALLGMNFSEAKWFQEALADKVKPGTSFVEDPVFDDAMEKVIGHPGMLMNFTSPIRDPKSGSVLGVWTNRVCWDDVVEAILKEESAKIKNDRITNVFPYLLSKEGVFLSHPQKAEVLKSRLGDFSEMVALGEKTNGTWTRDVHQPQIFANELLETGSKSRGYSSYPSQGWYAMIQVPFSDNAIARNKMVILVASLLMGIVLFLAFRVVTSDAKILEAVMGEIQEESEKLLVSSNQISTTSQSLAEGSSEQASAVQETSSALDETNAMIQKNAENASESIRVANKTQSVANDARNSMDNLVGAINEIGKSNESILDQVNQSNEQMGSVVKLIREIEAKTRVINDIVFQTKLLSFNASVEAARAGEAGKGFAVVAEEVGNLAQMSGKAASEITTMLDSRVIEVERIVEKNKREISTLVETGLNKVRSGQEISSSTSKSLSEAIDSVASVTMMIGEIATATKEQATGVGEITKAVNDLQTVIQSNAESSQVASSAAHDLMKRASALGGLVNRLEDLIEGEGRSKKKSSRTKDSTGSGSGKAIGTVTPIKKRFESNRKVA